MANAKPALKSDNQKLTLKEQVFLENYFISWNATKAALAAGYCIEHPVNAKMAGYEILNKPYIKAAINERLESMCMEANEVLARLAAIARADITNYMRMDAETEEWFVDINALKADGMGFLIKSYVPNRLGRPTVELYSAMDALDKLAKHLNLLKQPEERNINISLTAWSEFVQRAREESEVSRRLEQANVIDGTSY